MYQHLLVAVDGSEFSARALQRAATLAQALGSKLTVVHAYPATSDIVGRSDYSIALAKRTEKGQHVLDAACATLEERGVQVTGLLEEGPAADAIARVASARDVDLILIGSRGLGWVKGVLLGSVSRRVCQEAPCSVLLIREF